MIDVHLNEKLLSARRAAADASGGTSGNIIYAMIDKLIRAHSLGGVVLDYGAGLGNLAIQLRRPSVREVYGADIMPRPSGLEGITWIQQDLNRPLDGHDEHFDLIVAAEVIEHLENPRLMARNLYRMCRPGGHVIITTPNNESIRAIAALIVRGNFVYFGDSSYPAHITALLRKDLARVLTEAGFEEPTFDFTNSGAIPGATRFKWQRLSSRLFKGLRFSDNVCALARKPTANPELH